MKQQRSTLEKRNPLEERKSGDAVGRPSRRSSLLGDPGEKFLGGKLKSSLNSVSTCVKVVDTRRRGADISKRLVEYAAPCRKQVLLSAQPFIGYASKRFLTHK